MSRENNYRSQHDASASPGHTGAPQPGSGPQSGSGPLTGKAGVEAAVAKLWQEVLGLPRVGLEDNFFDMGGTSLLATLLLSKLNQSFGQNLLVATVFEYPTVRSMAEFLAKATGAKEGKAVAIAETRESETRRETRASTDIAIIGMTGRFPGADTVESFWENLCAGVESVTFFDRSELETKERTSELPANYIAARPIIRNADMFDAEFFGIYPKEAEQMDPQHRVFLECAWEVMERAGYDPLHTKNSVGVFAGCSMNTYFMHNIVTGRQYLEDFTGQYQVGSYVTMMGNDKDFLPTRISYKLNLRGPSIAVQSACSTSLVAVSQACQSLLTHSCDMALAGAVSITFPQHRGYAPAEGGLASFDGHCRPFDHRASGTIFGHGVGILLLKRLDDAIADGDQVLAVVRGFAINNDGSTKVGYTAPGVDGQSDVVLRAQKMAGVSAESISYIEAHGTATPLGDPIEVAALTKAFSKSTQATQFCAIGTAKANVGHLDVAAGATGLIKTVLQLKNRTIPKLLHFEKPNPHIDLERSPFYVARETQPWKTQNGPLRAGVSAFGIGGTNAHVIVEEAPALPCSDQGREKQLLVWSAKTPTALNALTENLRTHLEKNPGANLADVAYTLQVGRTPQRHRCAVVADSAATAIAALGDAKAILREDQPLKSSTMVFCFPGQGVQMIQMGRRLYETEPVFREALEECTRKLLPLLGESLLDILYPLEGTPEAAARLNNTVYAQPAIFAFEYSLAQLWLSWGIKPDAMVGHSVGEYVALCLAEVLSLDDALQMIATRGRLMQSLPRGSMLAVRANEAKVMELAGDTLDLAAVNGPQLCVVSGPDAAIEAFMPKLDGEKITHRRLVTSHAFHSKMVDPALAPFADFVRTVSFHEPKIPVVSTLTGKWITAEDVAETSYWTRQLRHAVRFADAIRELAATPERIFLEVGPSETLVQLIRQTIGKGAALASLPAVREGAAEDQAILSALGRLWTLGAAPDWKKFHSTFRRKRILLPTYPFERKRYWITPPQEQSAAQPALTMAHPPLEETPIEVTSSSNEDLNMATAVAGSASMLNELKDLLTDLSGVELADADPGASFFELGFDSLFLTQLTQGIHGKYKVKLTFRQVMESYPTLETLAAHLDATVPAELRATQPAAAAPVVAAAPAAPSPAVAAVAVQPAPTTAPSFVTAPLVTAPVTHFAAAPSGSLEALFATQTQALSSLFQQQIAALHGQPAVSAPITQPAAVAQAAVVPVAAPAPVVMPATAAASAPQAAAEDKPAKPVFTPFKPLQRGTETGLNATQQKYLQGLVQKYTQRTAKSKEFTQAHRSVFADGRVVSGFNAQIKELIYPLVVEKASGAYLWDKDGNRYIDILNGFGAIFFGHSPEWLTEAIRKQLEFGFPIGPQTELAGECAELVRDLTGMERVTFCNTGSEAVMGAMRIARTVTGRNLIVMFSGDYHGSFDEVLVKAVGGHRSMPVAPGIPRESVANTLVLDYGTPESLEIIRKRAGEIAAVLVEPVQSRHPDLRPKAFLEEVRRITEQNGAALIFDEVVTGFRTHPGGMQAVYGIRADMATYGKVVAGGLPVGVLAGSPQYMDALDGGQWQYGDNSFPEAGVTFYAGTFMRHPLALAAVRACMQHLKDNGASLQTAVADKTAALVRDLQGMFHDFSHPSSLETYSSWFYFSVPGDPFLTRLLHFHLREQGVHIQEGFPCFLTIAHTDSDLDFVREAFYSSFRQMRDGQALPNSVIEGVAAVAGSDVPAEKPAVEAPVAEAAETEVRQLPITEEQREILLGTQLGEEANCAFNESTSLTLQGELNETALCDALKQLVNRHDALRFTFDAAGEIANIAPSLELDIEREDLSSLSPAEQSAEMTAILENEGSTPFDLVNGPLVRARLVRLGAREHKLIFTAHHIIFDGWSTNVFYNELSDLYNAAVTHTGATLPAALSFSQYARQRAETAGGPDQQSVETYWLEQFKTQPSPLQIPTDRPRPEMRSHKGKSSRFVLDRELFAAVRKAGARQGCTLFATLMASTALLIHRLAEQDDLVLGIPMAGQSKTGNGSTLVGHCVNFLPIRSRMQPDVTLSQFLKQTRNTLLDAYDNQDYTYGTLLHKLKMQRDPSRLQLIEVQFNVEQVGAELKFADLFVDLQANPKTHVNMDIFFNFVDRGTELWLDCDFNTDLFDDSTIERWFGHLEAILRAFTENSELPCTQAPLLTPQQEQEILIQWNQTSTEYPRDASLSRVFEQQAKNTPNAIAIITEEHTLTYAELNEKANQLARFLVRAGVKPGSTVALSLQRSAEAIVSLLAILKTGAAYVPIDPSYPAPRLTYLVNDSAAKVLLTSRAIAENLPKLATNIICLDADWPAIAVEDTHNLAHEGTAEDLAYIMYTSGSTGNPKGVLVPHRAVLRLVLNNSFADFGPNETFLQIAPLSFDASTFEIWGALLNGGRLVIGPAERLTPEEIGRIIRERGVTTLWLTAAFFHLVVTEHLEILRPLHQLLAGGDSLSLTHVTHVCEKLPHLKLINGYGPTENTTFTCCHPITLRSLASGTVPIGRPIANTRIYILDAQRKPVPVGVSGELYAAGDGIAMGYLNAPELTAEKFVNHTFANGVSERLYRTGDLARYRPDGTVEFQGRIDTQVKVRGYRIELAEIEYALEQSPKVRSAVVAVRTDWVSPNDAPGDKRLVAYIVPAQAGDSSGLIQELRKQLQEQLPNYMQPAAIMTVESFPRTLNGKIDRRALPAPVPEQLMRQRSVVAPRNEREATMASIWEKVLGLNEISVDDSIFEVGGDSLLIFRITTMANQVGLKVTARHFFQYKTIADICGQLAQAGDETASAGVATIQAIPRAQRRRKLPSLQ